MTATLQWQQTCPLCGGNNRCAIAAGEAADSCWCRDTRIDPAALAAIPADSAGKRCLCPACGKLTKEVPHER